MRSPYVIEPCMRVLSGSAAGIVIRVDAVEPAVVVSIDGRKQGVWLTSCCTPDIEHAGTRGLLLQQYRERSGHAHAITRWSGCGGKWAVDPDPNSSDGYAGEGPTEGAAIINVLTWLHERSKAREVDELVHTAEEAAKAGVHTIAAKLYAFAARAEEACARKAEGHMRDRLRVSAAALWMKAGSRKDVKRLVDAWDVADTEAWARAELRAILEQMSS